MPIITELPTEKKTGLETVKVSVDRLTLQKKRWRTVAEDGVDIAVDLEGHCHHGETVYESEDKAYVIEQLSEPVIIVAIPESQEEAAMMGWVFGNQHIPVQIKDKTIRVAADENISIFLKRNHIHSSEETGHFSPSPHSRVHHHHH